MSTSESENLGPIRRPLWFYIKKNPRSFFSGMLTLAGTNFLDGIWPLWLKDAIDLLPNINSMSNVAKNAAMFFFILSSLAVTRFLWRIYFAKFQLQSSADLAERLFKKILSHSPQVFQKSTVGEYLSLLTNDIQSFRQAMGPGLLIFADGVMIIIIVLPIMFRMQAEWTIKTLSLLPMVPFLIWAIMRQIQKRYSKVQDQLAVVTSFVQESVNGVRVIKSFALKESHLQEFEKQNSMLRSLSNKVAQVDSLFGPVMTIGVTTGNVILLFVAQNSLISGAVSVGSFIAFQRYIQKMVWPMTALGMGLSMIQKGKTSVARINSELEKVDNIQGGTLELKTPIHEVEFKNVSFVSEEKNLILDQINFKLLRGDKLAITGQVGSGKSVLLQLLTRQLDPSSGEILINSKSILEYDIRSLRDAMAVAPQEIFLFSSSVEDNIAFNDLDSKDSNLVKQISSYAGLDKDIESFPAGIRSMLGEKGVNISGGQKQRLSLARALYKTSDLLIIDDSLSAVDTETEKTIQSGLASTTRNAIQIIVAHRLSSLKHCNKILVLSAGKLEFFGDCDGDFEKLKGQSKSLDQILKIQGAENV